LIVLTKNRKKKEFKIGFFFLYKSVKHASSHALCKYLTLAQNPKLCGIVSGAEVPGEGELKLFEFLSTQADRDKQSDQSALVVTGDSDVLLFSLLSNYRNIDILRLAGRGLFDFIFCDSLDIAVLYSNTKQYIQIQ